MLEKFILGLFIMISNMLMRARGKGVCAGLCGEAGQGCRQELGTLLGGMERT